MWSGRIPEVSPGHRPPPQVVGASTSADAPPPSLELKDAASLAVPPAALFGASRRSAARPLQRDASVFLSVVDGRVSSLPDSVAPLLPSLGRGRRARAPAPTALAIIAHHGVRAAMEAAWTDSRPDDPERRHEEGGWVVMSPSTRELRLVRSKGGEQAHIDLSKPPEPEDDALIVATFHTHPNPVPPFEAGPSRSDLDMDRSRGVPGIIRSVLGYHGYAWEARNGGMTGGWFFPGTPERPL